MSSNGIFRSGYVGIVGRPNVGKSTLLNSILKEKVSIVTRKPQTTRHHVLGVHHVENAQIVFIDTPGMQIKPKQALNHYMNREAMIALNDIDIVLFVVEALKWRDEDEHLIKILRDRSIPSVCLVINKTDKIKNKKQLLPFIENIGEKFKFDVIVPVSAKTNKGLDELEKIILDVLPERPPFYPDEYFTDRSERFFAAEYLREKLMNRLSEELPYQLTITIEEYKNEGNICHIHACIWVEKEGQKNIVIGKGGSLLKQIGREARLDMEKLLECKVNLKTWVKVKKSWTDSEQALKTFGYD